MYVYCCRTGSCCNHCAHVLATGLVFVTPFRISYPVKVLRTESQFSEDLFVDTFFRSHDANAREEASDTTTDGDFFLQQCIFNEPRC